MSTLRTRRRAKLTADQLARLAALDAQIAAEDAEDYRREARRVKAGLPEPPRTPIKTFEGWVDSGAWPGATQLAMR